MVIPRLVFPLRPYSSMVGQHLSLYVLDILNTWSDVSKSKCLHIKSGQIEKLKTEVQKGIWTCPR